MESQPEERPCDRLRRLREVRHDTAADFARAHKAHGAEEGTYRSHENGNRGFDFSTAKKYAGWLGARDPGAAAKWIMDGGEPPADINEFIPRNLPLSRVGPSGNKFDHMIMVNELDTRAAAGHGGAALEISNENEADYVVGQYGFPAPTFLESFGSPGDRVRICNIVGNSMIPDLLPGQRVMVDTGDKTPSPPGVFFVWDGLGLVCKLVEYIPHSEPMRVRISSKNPDFAPYERFLDEAHICGRVIGVWQRT